MLAFSTFASNYGKVVFVESEGNRFHIATMNPDGTDVTVLTKEPGEYENPRWSPDGKRIAYNKFDDENKAYQLWMMNSDGSSPEIISNSSYWGAAWSPDSKKIAFMTMNNGMLVIMDLKTREITPLVDAAAMPVWSPDGKTIVYEPISLSPQTLYLIDPVTQRKWNIDLTERGIAIYHKKWSPVAFSPDDQKIAFLGASLIKSTWGIYIMDSDGTNVIEKYTGNDGGLFAQWPTWSPDGKQIMFDTRRGIEKMDVDGEVPTLVRPNGMEPDWLNSPSAASVSPQSKTATTWGYVKHDSSKK